MSGDEGLELTAEIGLLLGVLGVTLVLFVTELVRIDVVALLIMAALPWLGLLTPAQAFGGLSSGAVLSIIAVLIMGHGLERTGVASRLAEPILRVGGGSRRRTLAGAMGMVGVLSAFMPNVGAAAVFLPTGRRVARVSGLSPSQLLMPVGFAAILGGTLTMVGSSPLILLSDLLAQRGLPSFDLFAVTPIGLVLLGAGVLMFVVTGTRVLPDRGRESTTTDIQHELLRSWSLADNIEELMIPSGSPLVGQTRTGAGLISRYGVHVVAIRQLGRTSYAPRANHRFAAGERIAVHGRRADIEQLAADLGLRLRERAADFQEAKTPERVGYAELLVSPRAGIIGRSVRQIQVRGSFGVEPMALLSGGESRARDFADCRLKAGDILAVYGPWKDIRRMGASRDFVLLTRPKTEVDTAKALRAAACFLGAVLITLVGFPLPLAFFSGAVAMVVTGVVDADEAYNSVSWRSVFLLAGLIPLGIATQTTGTAEFVATHAFAVLDGAHPLVVLSSFGVLTTVFTLFMSNIAATVILAPLAMDLGLRTGIDPRAMALLVGICAQNSFVLPTHQVNALLMAPGGYRSSDYLRVGGVLTVLFLLVAVLGIWGLWT